VIGISLLTLVPGLSGGSETYAGLERAQAFTWDACARAHDDVYRELSSRDEAWLL
jgi:hypothetical protein